MRIFVIATAMALIATPALAHHKPNHSDFRSRTQVSAAPSDPCQARRHRHRQIGSQSVLSQHCRELRDAVRAAPDDAALRARCDEAARALSGRACD